MNKSAARPSKSTTNTPVRLQMLGTYEVECFGQPVAIATRKAAAILAILSMKEARSHTRERIASILWSDSGSDQAKQSLRQALFTVRRACESAPDPITTDGDKLAIVPEVVSSDVQEFEAAAQADTVDGLEAAVDLYRGEFLEGFHLDERTFESWVHGERERLRQLAIDSHLRLLYLLVERASTAHAIRVALRLLAIEPTHEATHRTLMRLYVAQGRRDAALRQYDLCADVLFDALRVRPSPETTKLYEELRNGAASIAAESKTPDRNVREITPSRGGKKLALLVEDSALNQKLITAMLDGSDFEVISAEDGAKALLQMGKHRFDLILLDLSMPRLSGFDVLEVMRENHDDTPVIVLTGASEADFEVRALEMGAADYLRKPVNRAVLLKRIEKALSS